MSDEEESATQLPLALSFPAGTTVTTFWTLCQCTQKHVNGNIQPSRVRQNVTVALEVAPTSSTAAVNEMLEPNKLVRRRKYTNSEKLIFTLLLALCCYCCFVSRLSSGHWSCKQCLQFRLCIVSSNCRRTNKIMTPAAAECPSYVGKVHWNCLKLSAFIRLFL